MANDPTIADVPLLPPPTPPTIISCPGDFMKHKSACFKFGSHSSYEMAKTACESFGARLANIDSTFGKYIRDQVRTMGGNDFWIGSFINRGRVYRQKGRTSCPIMRGQMINDALYGLVDCNSANRYICQKYGPIPDDGPGQNPFGAGNLGLPSRVPTTKTTTEMAEEAEGGGSSPVIYVVITVVLLIVALIALKFLVGRFMQDRKKKKKGKEKTNNNPTKKKIPSDGKGMVFSPKYRKDTDSKRTSVDSAVPPSNHSATLEKKPERRTPEQSHEEMYRMGRPRVNDPQPTRLPPDMEDDYMYRHRQQRDMERDLYGKESASRKHRRNHSDPRSDYTDEYNHKRRSGRRRRYSDTSYSRTSSETESDSSGSSGHRYGPKKVFQRQASRGQMGREPIHYNIDPSHYGPPRRDRHRDEDDRHRKRSRSRGRSAQVYHNEGYRDEPERRRSRGDYGNRERVYGSKNHPQMPTISGRVYNQSTFERLYFPEPHRLMSWANMGELNDFSSSAANLVDDNSRSFPREPIRVSRQIHQPQQKSTKSGKKSKHKDENHVYESLDEMKRNKLLKKASERNKSRKKREARKMTRASESRASMRSIASIQSRRLPTPPL